MAYKLDDTQLLQYVKEVVQLESSCYSQKQAIAKVSEKRDKISSNVPCKEKISKPVLRTIKEPQKPVLPEKPYFPIWSVLLLLLGIGGIVGAIICATNDLPGIAILCGLFGILFISLFLAGIFWAYIPSKKLYLEQCEKYEVEQEQYEEAMSKLEKRKAQAEIDYKKSLERYNKQIEESEQSFKLQQKDYKTACKEIESSVLEMTNVYKETQKILNRLYSLDVVFPKYRNIVAMATILEYLESGRCSELKGKNGAYNLYESELLQNRIIDRLDTVISQLEQVKDNQFILYSEIQKANKTISYIAKKANQISDSAKRTEATSAITAYCSQITAANTTALAFIECFK